MTKFQKTIARLGIKSETLPFHIQQAEKAYSIAKDKGVADSELKKLDKDINEDILEYIEDMEDANENTNIAKDLTLLVTKGITQVNKAWLNERGIKPTSNSFKLEGYNFTYNFVRFTYDFQKS